MANDVDSLRGLISPSLDHFWKAACIPLMGALDVFLDKSLGPKSTRIGVFGPYPKGGSQIILSVAKIVSELGYNAVTGLGTFAKNNPNNLVGLMDAVPNHAKKIRSAIPDRVVFHELPRLVSKAVIFENDERGQYEELSGCFEHKTPSLGFIRHRIISKSGNCEFLVDKGPFAECYVSEPTLCARQSKNGFCPFCDSVDIPWFTKEMLLAKDHGNRLIAVKSIGTLRTVIKGFLDSS
jgi:hypothetical protein